MSEKMDGIVCDVVNLAKAWLIRQYEWNGKTWAAAWRGPTRNRPEIREWGYGIVVPDSYEENQYRVSAWVRLGSPPKGYVLETPVGAVAIDCYLDKTKSFLREHYCDVDYRAEHACVLDPVVLAAIRGVEENNEPNTEKFAKPEGTRP